MNGPEDKGFGDGALWKIQGQKLAEKIERRLNPSLDIEANVVVARVGGTSIRYNRIDVMHGIGQRLWQPAPLITIFSHGRRYPVPNIENYQTPNPQDGDESVNRHVSRYLNGRTLLSFNPPEGWLLGEGKGLEEVQGLLKEGIIQRYTTIEDYEKAIIDWPEILGSNL